MNFYDYVNQNTDLTKLKGLDAEVTVVGISRDDSSVEYTDNYRLNADKLEKSKRLDAKLLNNYVKVIPTGMLIEPAQSRINYYVKIANFRKEEKELE